MKSYRTTLILIGLFFAILLALLGLEVSGVYTAKERALRESYVLPDLFSVPQADIDRIAIEHGSQRMVFERIGQETGLWQMVEPTNVAAEPSRLETLVRDLKELRRSPDTGSYDGVRGSFGLEPPRATVRVWSHTSRNLTNRNEGPTAVLAVGNSCRDGRYIRAGATGPIEIANAKSLAALDDPMSDWRQAVVMALPTFQANSVTISRGGRTIRAERTVRGQWRMTEPVVAPANHAKIESLLAALSSLRVVDGAKGFIADNVSNFASFGLDPPAITIAVTPIRPNSAPLVIHVGSAVPDRPGAVYVRQGEQDDVVVIDGKAIAEIPTSAAALRSQQVSDFEPALVDRIEVGFRTKTIELRKESSSWTLVKPTTERADDNSVQVFLNGIRSVETSEFLDTTRIQKPEVDPPFYSIRLWQQHADGTPSGSTDEVPVLSLRVGRHDLLRKTVYAQMEHDDAILALPDTFLDVLPRAPFPFRMLTLATDRPEQIRSVTIARGNRIDQFEPAASGEPNRWRMKRPVGASADISAVTELLTSLCTLRAEAFVAPAIGDGKAFGLDRPLVELAWQTDRIRRLRIGHRVPKSSTFYAALDDQPFVFTLGPQFIERLQAEFHDHRVMSFSANSANRILLHWPNRTLAIRRRTVTARGQSEWVGERDTDAGGFDFSRIGALVNEMSKLQTLRFAQYDGPIPVETGLLRPRLVVEVELGPPERPRMLRIGHTLNDEVVFVAEEAGDSGPVFFLPSKAWDALIKSGERFEVLPADVFAPGE